MRNQFYSGRYVYGCVYNAWGGEMKQTIISAALALAVGSAISFVIGFALWWGLNLGVVQ